MVNSPLITPYFLGGGGIGGVLLGSHDICEEISGKLCLKKTVFSPPPASKKKEQTNKMPFSTGKYPG